MDEEAKSLPLLAPGSMIANPIPQEATLDIDGRSKGVLPVSKSWAEHTAIYHAARLYLWLVKRVVICKRWQHQYTPFADISQQHTRQLLREQHLLRRSEYRHIQ